MPNPGVSPDLHCRESLARYYTSDSGKEVGLYSTNRLDQDDIPEKNTWLANIPRNPEVGLNRSGAEVRASPSRTKSLYRLTAILFRLQQEPNWLSRILYRTHDQLLLGLLPLDMAVTLTNKQLTHCPEGFRIVYRAYHKEGQSILDLQF